MIGGPALAAMLDDVRRNISAAQLASTAGEWLLDDGSPIDVFDELSAADETLVLVRAALAGEETAP